MATSPHHQLQSAYAQARHGRGPDVLCAGIHAVKHAIRFGAQIREILTIQEYDILTHYHALISPKEAAIIEHHAQYLSEESFAHYVPEKIRTQIVARVKKDQRTLADIAPHGFIIVLEDPRDLGNIGAVIRVCAARGVAAVLTIGSVHPWHVNVLRGAAGLHFAQPVVHIDCIQDLTLAFPERPLIACSDEGNNMYHTNIHPDSILVFGTERAGITPQTKTLAQDTIAIPMRHGVSSMNLATAVSAILFHTP